MLKIKAPKELLLPKDEQPKCVIKIKAGRKFFIGRSLNFEFIGKELRRLLRGYNHYQEVNNHLYYPIIKYLSDKKIEEIEVEILFQSESGYQILKEELRQLEANVGKRNCLNQNTMPHIPKFKTSLSTTKWLTHNEFLNFKKLLIKHNAPSEI